MFLFHDCTCLGSSVLVVTKKGVSGISVIFVQTYLSFDIQNAKCTSWTDISLSFSLKRGLPALFKQNFYHQKFTLNRNVLSIFCVPRTHYISFFASQIIFLRKIRNILR